MSLPADIPLLEQHWVCVKGCPEWATTRSGRIPMHRCREMHGLDVPLIREGTKAKVETREREDYLAGEHAQGIWVDGKFRPVMSIVTTRDDGQDCAVLAPLAVGSTEET